MIDLKRKFIIKGVEIENFLNISREKKEMVLDWRNHDSIRKWMYSDKIISLEEHTTFCNQLIEDNENFYWIAKSKDGNFVGIIYLNRTDFKNKHAYIGIYSNPFNEIKNKGYLLIRCIKNLAFEIAGLHTLKLEVIDNNQKAIDFYKKSGFNEEGKLKEFVFRNDQWHDVIVMGIVKNL